MKRSFKIVNRNFARIMGNNRKKTNKKGQSKGNSNNESDRQNIEGKCAHVQECVKFGNLNNTIPHADLSKCSECLKLADSPSQNSNDQKSEGVEDAVNGSDLTQTDKEPDGICVCLRCGHVACSRQSTHQHAVKHYDSKSSHSLAVNLTNWVIWCYKCDNEVDVEVSAELGKCLSLLKKALGLKTATQEKRNDQPQKKSSTNICTLSGKTPAVRGLSNLGNTCFFNSVMQNLCQSQLFRVAMNHLIAKDFKYCVLPNGENQELAPLSVTVTDKPGPLTTALAKFLQDMKSEAKKNVVNPGYLFSEICKQAPRFKGFRQQDSQELLRYLLDSVRTEEIKGVKRAILRSFGVKSSQNEEGVKADKVDEEIHEKIRVYGRNARAPVIDTLFCGQLVSSVECCTCHKVADNNINKQQKFYSSIVSTIKENFLDLSLSLATNMATTHNPVKRQNTAPATKKKQPQAPVVNKNNTAKKAEKDTTEKQKLPTQLSKHQLKKIKKETKKSKKKGRKRHNSTSSTGRKQSEVDEDTDDDENKGNSVDDVTGTSVDDVTGTSVGDVTGTSVGGVTGTSVDDVTGTSVDDVTNSSSEKDLSNVKEHVSMNLAKVDEDGVNVTSRHDVTGTSQATGTSGNDDAETTSPLDFVEDPSAVALDRKDNFEERNDVNDERIMVDGNNIGISNQECLNKCGGSDNTSEMGEGEVSNHIDSGKPLRNNKISQGNRECQEGSLLKENDVSNSAHNQHKDCEMTSENTVGDCENSRLDEEVDEDNANSLQSNGKDLSNFKEQQEQKTSLGFEEMINNSDSNVVSSDVKGNGESEDTRSSCKASVNSDHEKNGICKDSLENDGTCQSQDGEADGMNFEESNEAGINSRENQSDSSNDSRNSSHNNTSSLTKFEHDEAVESISEKLSKLSLDNNNKNSPNESREEPVSFRVNSETCAQKNTETESDAFVANSTALAPNSDWENAKESQSVRDFVDQLLDALIENVMHEILTSVSEEVKKTSDAKIETENHLECKTTNEKLKSLADCSPQEKNIDRTAHELKEYSANETVCSLPPNEEEFVESEAVKNRQSSLSSTRNSSSFNEEDSAKIREFVSKIIDEGIEQALRSISTTQKDEDDSKNEDNSKYESLESRKLESKELNGDLENLEAVSEPDDASGISKSEILSGNHSLGSMEEIKSNSMSVESCLKRFCSPEVLEGNNMFICERCNQQGSDGEESGETKDDETKDDETKDDKTKDDETKDDETKDDETKDDETKDGETKGDETKGDETKDDETKDDETKDDETKGDETKDDETKDDETQGENNDDKDASAKKKSKRKPIYTEAVKQLLIKQAPPVLTLHLKRFHQVGYSLKKIAKHVDFPVELDLAPFCHKSCKLATDMDGKILYSLFGVVEHSGGLHSGHYTAYCRVPTTPSSLFDTKFENLTQLLEVMDQTWTQGGKRESYVHESSPSSRWFHISDTHVSEVSLERVLKSQAYLLFYERMVLTHGGDN